MMTTKRKIRPSYFTQSDWGWMFVFALCITALTTMTNVPQVIYAIAPLSSVVILVASAGIVPRRGAVLIVALLSAIMTAFLAPGNWGFIATASHFATIGLALEGSLWLLGSPYQWLVAGLSGAVALTAEFAIKWLIGLSADVPASLVQTQLSTTALSNVVIGFLGGFIACLILIALARANMVDDSL